MERLVRQSEFRSSRVHPYLTCSTVSPPPYFIATARLPGAFISTPNAEWCPWINPIDSEVFFRGDGTLGEEDPTCWPRPYDPKTPHLACIPLYDCDPLSVTRLFRDGFKNGNVQPEGFDNCDGVPLVRLDDDFHVSIKIAAGGLFSRAEEFLSRYPRSAHPRLVKLVTLAKLTLTNTIYRSESFLNLHFVFGLTGRFLLEICGYLSYHTEFLPRLSRGRARGVVDSIIGTIVDESSDCTRYAMMGVPVWQVWMPTKAVEQTIQPTAYVHRKRLGDGTRDDGCFRSLPPLLSSRWTRVSKLLVEMDRIVESLFTIQIT